MTRFTLFIFTLFSYCSAWTQTLDPVRLFIDVVPDEHTDQIWNVAFEQTEHRARLVHFHSDNWAGLGDFSKPFKVSLFPDVEYDIQLTPDSKKYLQGLQVWKGRVADARFDHLPYYINTILVHNPHSDKWILQIEAQEGFFQILPSSHSDTYRIRDCKSMDQHICGGELIQKVLEEDATRLTSRSTCGGTCFHETDQNGRYVIDLFVGYSESAALVAGDLLAYAVAQVESVNTGLTNSGLDGAYLRLVGTAITPNNPGVVTSVLNDAWDWFADEIEALAPDVLSIYQTDTGAPGSAGGWGYLPGRISVNSVYLPTAFRHEMGHNVGGHHCHPDHAGYRNGFDNGNWRTHLCGNDVNFYSTPLINDNLGNPIGHADQADMVRLWNEEMAKIAQYAAHRIPYFDGDDCVNQICLPSHWGGQIELIRRVQFHTIDNNQTTPDWNCPTVTGYSDFIHIMTSVTQGESYLLTVTPTFSWAESKLGIWIDWDHNGILTEQEKIADFAGTGPWSTMVDVPLDAALEQVRLRIRLQYGQDYTPHPCNGSAYSSGETEDYTVQILPGFLPINLVSFFGKSASFGNWLIWQTETELESSHFVLEKSEDGGSFESMAIIPVKGSGSEYTHFDSEPFMHTYYRLKMVDLDGSVSQSNIINIKRLQEYIGTFTLFPNPSNGQTTLECELESDGTIQLHFTNLIGQTMLTASYNLKSGNNTLLIDTHKLPAGLYMCSLVQQNKNVATIKFVKQ